jgi:uncharacterized membrane protein YjgN (DUF898 family)
MDKKEIEFTGKAGDYFVVFIVVAITTYIPLFGWPIGFNYMSTWLTDNILIKGSKIKYTAGYVETLKFLFINLLLTLITLGIYTFWFVPKTYRYVVSHTAFVDGSTPSASPAPAAPAPPTAPTPPSPPSPEPPITPNVTPPPASTPPAPLQI